MVPFRSFWFFSHHLFLGDIQMVCSCFNDTVVTISQNILLCWVQECYLNQKNLSEFMVIFRFSFILFNFHRIPFSSWWFFGTEWFLLSWNIFLMWIWWLFIFDNEVLSRIGFWCFYLIRIHYDKLCVLLNCGLIQFRPID